MLMSEEIDTPCEACPACGAEPGVNIDCAWCLWCSNVLVRIERLTAELIVSNAEVERLRMKAGRHLARVAVFMQAMSWLARNGMQVDAQRWIVKADEAAEAVMPEDFVIARVNESGGDDA